MPESSFLSDDTFGFKMNCNGKSGQLKPRDLSNNPISLEECRKLFKVDEYGYTDEELFKMRDFLFKLAKIYYGFYITTLQHRAKIISINNQPYGTEESNHLCTSKHRRAS